MQSSGSNVMLALYNGTSVMGYMGDSTVPTTYKDGTTGNFNDVTVGMSVTITYNGSRITKMVINADAPKKEEQILKGNIAYNQEYLDLENVLTENSSKHLWYYIASIIIIVITIIMGYALL